NQGPLSTEFARVGKVHELASLTEDEVRALAAELYREGARAAICNTAVVGRVARILKEAGLRVVSLIHELPGIIKQYRLEDSLREIAAYADHVVFAAPIVRDRCCAIQPIASEKIVIRPQGLYRE